MFNKYVRVICAVLLIMSNDLTQKHIHDLVFTALVYCDILMPLE